MFTVVHPLATPGSLYVHTSYSRVLLPGAVFPRQISGEWLFGLAVVDTMRRIESLPGAWRCLQYKFMYETREGQQELDLDVRIFNPHPYTVSFVSLYASALYYFCV